MDPIILRGLSILTGLFFLGIVFIAFKKGEISLGIEHITDFKRKDNPIGFCLTVMFWTFLAAISFYISFKL